MVGVPVKTISRFPDWGTVASEPDARLYPYGVPPTVNDGSVAFVLSNDATPITLWATPGAPADHSWPPFAPLLPIDATTTIPASTRLSEATASGDSGQLPKADPMLMLRTSAWSANASSIAWIITSVSVEPLQPNTR